MGRPTRKKPMSDLEKMAHVLADFLQEHGYTTKVLKRGGAMTHMGMRWVDVELRQGPARPGQRRPRLDATLTVEDDDLIVQGPHARHVAQLLDKRLADGRAFDCGHEAFTCVRLR
jgi:hypothetical protein